jgi:hypothetical protein
MAVSSFQIGAGASVLFRYRFAVALSLGRAGLAITGIGQNSLMGQALGSHLLQHPQRNPQKY